MSDHPIPPSPTAEDYAAQLAANADEAQFQRTEPLPLFLEWMADARRTEPNDSNAMALATATAVASPPSAEAGSGTLELGNALSAVVARQRARLPFTSGSFIASGLVAATWRTYSTASRH